MIAAAILCLPNLILAQDTKPTTGVAPARNDFQMVAGKRVGPILPGMTERDLRRVFGDRNVIDISVLGAEGATIDASLVFPNTADRLEVQWSDQTHTQIGTIKAATPGSRWRAGTEGVYVGMPLSQLVQRNGGKPIGFSGFDWDYGGYVTDWGRGRLWHEFGGKDNQTTIRFSYTAEQRKKLTARQYREVSGEQKVLSSAPAVRALQPYIGEISVHLR